MSEHQPNPAGAGDDDLAQMTPNQRRALNKALSALETMAALWASEIRLTDLSQRIADVPNVAERAKRIAAFVEQGFIEGAYRHYLDHKDEILHVDALEAANARIAELEAQIATVAPAVDAQAAQLLERAITFQCATCDDAGSNRARARLRCEMRAIGLMPDPLAAIRALSQKE